MRTKTLAKRGEQAHVCIGWRGVPQLHPDKFAIDILKSERKVIDLHSRVNLGETRNYVSAITGRTAEQWADAARGAMPIEPEASTRCLIRVASFRRGTDRRMIEAAYGGPIEESPIAPWGVQLAGNFSKDRALASYARARERHAAILGEIAPMVIGTRWRSRGTRAFYRVRIPAATRDAATELCGRLLKAGGACVVLKS